MRSRHVVTIAALAAAGVGLPSVADDAAARHDDHRAAQVRLWLLSCSREDHSAVFHARMRSRRGAERMAMRLTLLQRSGFGRFVPVRAPGLRRWRISKPGVKVLGWRQRVNGLADGGAYRLLVRFRWFDADGHRVATRRRRSGVCRQYDALPNLTAVFLWRAATDHPALYRYAARVANVGEAEAAATRLRLLIDGGEVDARDVPPLRPGEAQEVHFSGPPCQRTLEVVADADGAAVESDENDNRQVARCQGSD